MPRYSKKVAKAIQSMAIDYAAMNEALKERDWASAGLWAGMLRDAQLVVGVEIIANDELAERKERYYAIAKRREDLSK